MKNTRAEYLVIMNYNKIIVCLTGISINGCTTAVVAVVDGFI